MIKTFTIDYLRELLENTLFYNIGNEELFNSEEIAIVSFFEHLQSDEEVERYVDTYKQLIDEQNRANKKGVGVVAITDSPDIMNVRESFISPFSWGCQIRVTLDNRDKMIATIYDLINKLKGRKHDIAQLDNGKLVCVKTIGSEIDSATNKPMIYNGCFIGELGNEADFNDKVYARLSYYTNGGKIVVSLHDNDILFAEKGGKLLKINAKEVDGSIVFVLDEDFYEHNSFERYTLALSFNDIKMEQPFTLSYEEYCDIVFEGKATLCDSEVILSDDIVRTAIKRVSVNTTPIYEFEEDYTYVEPLEQPSELGISSVTSQLRSNFFVPKNHNDSISPTIQYTFVANRKIKLLKDLYDYGRYGKRSIETISPNTLFSILEVSSTWGEVEITERTAKLTDSVNVSNNDDGILTIETTFSLED